VPAWTGSSRCAVGTVERGPQLSLGRNRITADQPATNYTCSATSAGGISSKTVTINRDATAPNVSATPSSGPNGNDGWYNAPVDILAAAPTPPAGSTAAKPALTAGPDSATASASRSCTDLARNTAADSVAFQYDATAPTLNPPCRPTRSC
jgi:hypothetical protein